MESLDNIVGISKEMIDSLSPAEKAAVIKILGEIESNGISSTYNQILSQDYDEMPVDIDTFIEDDEYIGKITQNGSTIYPFWRRVLRDIFSPESNYAEVIFTGAIGLGKTTIAIIAMSYILHCLLCLKNPQRYYGLQGNSKIVFSFFNISLTLSYTVAYQKINSMLMESPWFLRHGKVIGREEKNKWYLPNKGIEFRVGSKESHGLGQDIFCMSGDTMVLTDTGWKRVDNLADNGKRFKVYSISDEGSIELSDYCYSLNTGIASNLVSITVDDGSEIRVTPDHRLMMNDGTYKMAKDIKINDDLKEIPIE